MVLQWRLHQSRGIDFAGSQLRSESATISQQQAAVKLHRVFSPRQRFVDCSSTLCGFTGLQAGTAGPSLFHSCTSELTRQGIWLTSVTFLTSTRKRGGLALRQPPCIATGVGLYLNRALAISGVESLRILDTAVSPSDSSSKPSLQSLSILRFPSAVS